MDAGDSRSGINDREIVVLASSNGRIILTRDSGFQGINLRKGRVWAYLPLGAGEKRQSYKAL